LALPGFLDVDQIRIDEDATQSGDTFIDAVGAYRYP
jgi:hypothetical protein